MSWIILLALIADPSIPAPGETFEAAMRRAEIDNVICDKTHAGDSNAAIAPMTSEPLYTIRRTSASPRVAGLFGAVEFSVGVSGVCVSFMAGRCRVSPQITSEIGCSALPNYFDSASFGDKTSMPCACPTAK